VLHVPAAKDLVRRRLKGELVEPSPEEDWPAVTHISAAAWQESWAALKRAQTEWQKTMARRLLAHRDLEGAI
jgi:hypothetical protein